MRDRFVITETRRVLNIRYLLLVSIGGAIIALDQLTKIFIHTRFRLGETLNVIPGFFDITYVRNFGAAFGILAQLAPQYREPFFTFVPVAAVIAILLLLRKTADSDRLGIFSYSLVFGGAIGNFIDRLRFGYVVDFLDFHWKEIYHWPAFNVADSAIVVGVGLMLLSILKPKKA